MLIESTRFGTFEVRDDTLLTFPDGLIGLPGTRYVLVAREEQLPFYWLQSVDEARVALPVVDPWLFFPGYEIRLADDEARRLELTSADEAQILCVVRAADELADVTANLVAPVVVNRAVRLGRQIITDAHGYSVRHRLFSEVELAEATAAGASRALLEATAV